MVLLKLIPRAVAAAAGAGALAGYNLGYRAGQTDSGHVSPLIIGGHAHASHDTGAPTALRSAHVVGHMGSHALFRVERENAQESRQEPQVTTRPARSGVPTSVQAMHTHSVPHHDVSTCENEHCE